MAGRPRPVEREHVPRGITMRANKRKKVSEAVDARETTGTGEADGAHEASDTRASNRGQVPPSRTPVEVFDDMIEQRRHPTPDPNDEDENPGLAWEQYRPNDEVRYGRIRGFQRQGGSLAPTNNHRGRVASWVSVVLACVGFILGGFAVAQGMSVVLLVIAGILLVAALVLAFVFDMFSDVVLDSPRVEPEEPHGTPLHRIKRARSEQEPE